MMKWKNAIIFRVEIFAFRSILTLTERLGLAIFSKALEKKPDSQKQNLASEEGDEKR
jgi:hypothetical protein